MLTRRLIALGLLFAAGLSAIPAHAVPPMTCILATLSANGRILVVNGRTFDDPDETHARMARKSTFQVFSRYSDAHQGLLDGPNSYWRHPGQPFGGRGVLVRQIPLSDLWPAERIQH
jgi:hypothetical protein